MGKGLKMGMKKLVRSALKTQEGSEFRIKIKVTVDDEDYIFNTPIIDIEVHGNTVKFVSESVMIDTDDEDYEDYDDEDEDTREDPSNLCYDIAEDYDYDDWPLWDVPTQD